MDKSVDMAADMAARYLATYSDGKLWLDKEETLDIFFYNLFAALHVLDIIPEQERLREEVICMLLVDGDGYFLWRAGGKEGGGQEYGWEEKVFFGENDREGMLEDAVYRAIWAQEERRGLCGGTYQLELPKDEGLWKRKMGEYGVFVMVRGIPEQNRAGAYEHFAFSGAALHKKN